MKATTREWLEFAKDDLFACEKLNENVSLTNIVAFHAQQVIEKCFKAIIEENGIKIKRTHDLTHLHNMISDKIDFSVDMSMLQIIDTVYLNARYPADLGLLPQGKPTSKDAKEMYEFAKEIFENTIKMIK